MNDRNSIAYWYPKMAEAGLKTPATEIVPFEFDADLLVDGAEAGRLSADERLTLERQFTDLVKKLASAAKKVGGGLPVFLRGSNAANKHDWKNACVVSHHREWDQRIRAQVMGALVKEIGRSCLAVRELLSVTPVAFLPAYGDFPLVPEVRCFIQHGEIQCWHQYWPDGAIQAGFVPHTPDNLDKILAAAHPPVNSATTEQARRAAEAFRSDGAWSIDLLLTKRGWYAIDMAEAGKSWHWPGCENEKRWPYLTPPV